VWIAHNLIHVTSSSNGYNSNPPVRDMTWSLTVASAVITSVVQVHGSKFTNHGFSHFTPPSSDTFYMIESQSLDSLTHKHRTEHFLSAIKTLPYPHFKIMYSNSNYNYIVPSLPLFFLCLFSFF
jgi:hypothetical protein